MTNPPNKPTETIRDGSMKAVIWGNPTENGTRYSVELVRSYKDEAEKWHDTNYLSNGEMLRGARLLTLAYDRVLQLRAASKA